MNDYFRKYKNLMMLTVFIGATIIALIPLFGVLGYVVKNGLSALNLQFFVNLPKAMGLPGGGMANAIAGTLIMVLIASALGIPIGILAAIYLTEYDRHSWLSTAVRFATFIFMPLRVLLDPYHASSCLTLKVCPISTVPPLNTFRSKCISCY